MSLLTLVQSATPKIGIPKPNTVISNADPQVETLLALANEEGEILARRGHWERLIKEKTFTSVDGMNVYRIIQEAVNNAIKYADSKTISVDVSVVNKNLSIQIKDEGKGFDVSSTELGNGINNIKKRAHELNAEIEINSTLNKGTSIILLKPINT